MPLNQTKKYKLSFLPVYKTHIWTDKNIQIHSAHELWQEDRFSKKKSLLFYSFVNFSHQLYLTVFHWSLSDNFPEISRTLLSIQADLKNAVVWIVSTCPLILTTSSSFINPLRIVPSAPITIGITVTLMFHCFY